MFPTIANGVKRIIFIRHFESVKNKNFVHGGLGNELTETGRKQIDDVYRQFVCLGVGQADTQIFHSTSVQTRETANIIASLFDLLPVATPLISSVYLGRLDGISDQEAEEKFNADYKLMLKWRAQEIEISELTDIGMEPPNVFWEKGVELLSSLSACVNVLVCSTSSMILLLHILCRRSYIPGCGYYHIPIHNAAIAVFDIANGKTTLNAGYTDTKLLEYIHYD